MPARDVRSRREFALRTPEPNKRAAQIAFLEQDSPSWLYLCARTLIVLLSKSVLPACHEARPHNGGSWPLLCQAVCAQLACSRQHRHHRRRRRLQPGQGRACARAARGPVTIAVSAVYTPHSTRAGAACRSHGQGGSAAPAPGEQPAHHGGSQRHVDVVEMPGDVIKSERVSRPRSSRSPAWSG